MTTTFNRFDSNDNVDNYTIKIFDNGIKWELRLINKEDEIVDSFNLERKIPSNVVAPVWNKKKVIQSEFNREDWNEDAPEEIIAKVKQISDEKNQTSLIDFIRKHNNSFLTTKTNLL